MNLRPARDEDREAILAIRNDPSVLARGRGIVVGVDFWQQVKPWLWVIEEADAVAGYIIVEPTHFLSVAVAPDKRNQGLASRALALCGGGVAMIDPENAASRMAFAKAGFKEQRREDRPLLIVRK